MMLCTEYIYTHYVVRNKAFFLEKWRQLLLISAFKLISPINELKLSLPLAIHG